MFDQSDVVLRGPHEHRDLIETNAVARLAEDAPRDLDGFSALVRRREELERAVRLALGWWCLRAEEVPPQARQITVAISAAVFDDTAHRFEARDSLSIDAGLRFAGNNNFEGGVFYTGLVNEDYASHGATIRFGFKF